ncbi:SUMF1/EgtB/PvdO family nonheme iron enzyme, partial [Desulfobulbus sp. TB]|nr:SUMF1/EgtB/PvdO family nonheme iron enzyme [Desulfobulbus sp. TB]
MAKKTANNPQGPKNGSDRVARGGSWSNAPEFVRSAFRIRGGPSLRNGYIGFRLARTNSQPLSPFTLAPAKMEQQEKADPLPPLVEPEMITLKGGNFQMGDISRSTWPPPMPSDYEEISQHFLNSYEHATLADVGNALQAALKKAGFKSTYLLLPEGFALVSNVDEFQSFLDGSLMPPSATKGSNTLDLLKALKKKPVNYLG